MCELRLRASSDGNHLIVKSVNESHNHEVSPVTVVGLPRKKKLKIDKPTAFIKKHPKDQEKSK
jgi:hypothetical protein